MLAPLLCIASVGFWLTLAAPQAIQSKLEPRQQKLPEIELPSGIWQATEYNEDADLYVFKNIRFGKAPVGNLRWAKPVPPEKASGIQTKPKGAACPQSVPASILSLVMPAPILSFAANFDLSSVMGLASGGVNEDCLFLDVFVPAKALTGDTLKLPVVNYIYGGAYILGSKDQIYDGTEIVKASGGNVIYVVGNYRLGAFGFLAGSTMEKDPIATPNAGFYDQRAVLEWIQTNIARFGGDPTNVNLWGESAGGGSIMHHLVAFGGKQEPLFKRAVIQSPANRPNFDRKGELENQFRRMENATGCEGKGLACMRKVSYDKLKEAQDKEIGAPRRDFGFGPTVDGQWVRQLPGLEFAAGNVVDGVESLIISHVAHEAQLFTQDTIHNETDWDSFVSGTYGTNPAILDSIRKQFPPPDSTEKYPTWKDRVMDYSGASTFTCNTRYIAEAFKGKSWNMQYSRGEGIHGMDIIATFFDPESMVTRLAGVAQGDFTLPDFMQQYQSYLSSHALTGDPNEKRKNGTIEWPMVEYGPKLGNVLDAGNEGFRLIEDETNTQDSCDFMLDVFAAVTNAGGYAPPGEAVESTILSDISEPSGNYS